MAAPRVDRRLAAIMAVDVVGYSRLVGADEAGTIARLKALRTEFIQPSIAEYRGRVVKLMGDGALVEFPSVLDAVACAVEIQRGRAERNAEVAPHHPVPWSADSWPGSAAGTLPAGDGRPWRRCSPWP